jgi:hypothetical protein
MGFKRKNLPVRILKIWFDIVVVLGGAATLLFLGWLALSPFLMAKGDLPSDATVRVVVGERSWLPVYRLDLTPGEGSKGSRKRDWSRPPESSACSPRLGGFTSPRSARSCWAR